MNRTEIKEQMTPIFRKVFSNPVLMLREDMTANDIEQWDSLTHMILITEIEKEFAVKFKLRDLNKLRNVGDMISLIESRL
ncbi:MAG: acyl carrier protein [Bacteroidales bacterium]|nr:acyl carrier protein [Bacteroidales bacterium]